MRIAIVENAELAAELESAGHEVTSLVPPGAGAGGAGGALAACLLAFERILEGARPDVAVVAGADDPAVALALVAVKLGVRLARVDGTDGEESVPRAGHVLALLADETLTTGDPPTIPGA